MRAKKLGLAVALVVSIGTVGAAFAQINATRHPHLADAQKYCQLAYQAITSAQRANDFDMGGHAAKAKRYLEKANEELTLAKRDVNADMHDNK